MVSRWKRSLPEVKVESFMGEGKESRWKEFLDSGSYPKKIVGVMSIESLQREEWMQFWSKEEVVRDCLVVWDEWHLSLNWESFRPHLLESFFELAILKINMVALTATLPSTFGREILPGLQTNYDHLYELDLGNYQWRYPPSQVHYFGRGTWMKRLMVAVLKGRLKEVEKTQKRFLLFVPRRRDVTWWGNWCQQHGIFGVVGCVGGGVEVFRNQMEQVGQDNVRVIVATSVLGHGVNLPPIDEVVLLGEHYEREMWVQLAGRGGRDGRPYQLWCRHWPGVSWMKKWRSWFKMGRELLF